MHTDAITRARARILAGDTLHPAPQKLWQGIPGVAYPERKPDVLSAPPPGYITTAAAAAMLDCTPSSARTTLARRGVLPVIVKTPSSTCNYYPLQAVRAVAEALGNGSPAPPAEDWLSSAETCHLLDISPATLWRYKQRGVLQQVITIRRTSGAKRRACYYARAEVAQLHAILQSYHRSNKSILTLIHDHETHTTAAH